MEANLRIEAGEVKDKRGPVADAIRDYKNYTYRVGFEHSAV